MTTRRNILRTALGAAAALFTGLVAKVEAAKAAPVPMPVMPDENFDKFKAMVDRVGGKVNPKWSRTTSVEKVDRDTYCGFPVHFVDSLPYDGPTFRFTHVRGNVDLTVNHPLTTDQLDAYYAAGYRRA